MADFIEQPHTSEVWAKTGISWIRRMTDDIHRRARLQEEQERLEDDEYIDRKLEDRREKEDRL